MSRKSCRQKLPAAPGGRERAVTLHLHAMSDFDNHVSRGDEGFAQPRVHHRGGVAVQAQGVGHDPHQLAEEGHLERQTQEVAYHPQGVHAPLLQIAKPVSVRSNHEPRQQKKLAKPINLVKARKKTFYPTGLSSF